MKRTALQLLGLLCASLVFLSVSRGTEPSPPVISYNGAFGLPGTWGNSSTTATRNLPNSVFATDESGVEVSVGMRPRIYYKKSTDANVFGANDNSFNGWKWVEATNDFSGFSFTIEYARLYPAGTVSNGDVIEFFAVAQDMDFITGPNVGSNPATGFAGTSVANVTSAPTSPFSYMIDVAPPTITYTPLGNTTSTSNRGFFDLSIGDPSGIPSAGLSPLVYYKKSSDPNTFPASNNSSSPGWKYNHYLFGLDYSRLYPSGTVSVGDVIQYFVIAQDAIGAPGTIGAGLPNVGSNPATGLVATSVTSITTAPTPNSYQIISAAQLDVGAVELYSPFGTCLAGGNFGRPVAVRIQNLGTTTINLSTNPVTVQTTALRDGIFSAYGSAGTLSFGTLSPGQSAIVSMGLEIFLSQPGSYTFNAFTSMSGDVNPSNNAISPQPVRLVAFYATLPYTQDFSIPAIPSGWTTSPPFSFLSNGQFLFRWLSPSTATTARFRTVLLQSISPSSILQFDYRIVNTFSGDPGTATPNVPAWGTIDIQVSASCGASFSSFATIDPSNHVSTTSWATKTYSLSSFAGQNIMFQFSCNWLSGDYYMEFDNFVIKNLPTIQSLTADVGVLVATGVLNPGQGGALIAKLDKGTRHNLNAFINQVSAFISAGILTQQQGEALIDAANQIIASLPKGAASGKENMAPIEFSLLQNYPNPFNPETNIRFSVETTERATLKLYDMLGREVATLFDEVAEPGSYYNVKLDGSSLASGVYLYRLQSGKRNELRKLVLLK
jgi:hypothetical protein